MVLGFAHVILTNDAEHLWQAILFCFIGVSVAPTSSGSYGDFQLLLVEEDLTRTIIGIFECMGRTIDVGHLEDLPT